MNPEFHSLKTNLGLRILILCAGVFCGTVVTISLWQKRGFSMWLIVPILCGVFLASMYFKTAEVRIYSDQLLIMKTWVFPYLTTQLAFKEIKRLENKNGYAIISTENQKVQLRYVEIAEGNELLKHLSEVLGIEIEYG